MGKRIAGFLIIMMGLAACGGVESAVIAEAVVQVTASSTQEKNLSVNATQDVTSLDDIKPGVTLVPTKDPLVTYTITPTPTVVPSFSNMQLTHDLVWLDRSGNQRGHLMRWDATQNEIEIFAGENEDSLIALPGKVTDFDLKAKTVLVSMQVGSDTNEDFELGSIDLETGEYLPLLNTSNSLSVFSKINEVVLSPNGRWAAYVLSESPVDSTSTADLTHGLHVLRISKTSVPVLFASCEKGGSETTCIESLRWSPDNSMLAWHGPGGMWIATLEGGSRLILPDFMDAEEARNRRYYPNSWAPNNEYIEIQVWGLEGGFKGVFNLTTSRFIDVPNTTFGAGTPYSETSWLPNGRLIVLESGYQVADRRIPSKVFIYSINADHEDEWLYLSDSYELEAEIGDRLFQDGQNDSQVLEFLRARILTESSLSNSTLFQVISLDLGSGEITELIQAKIDFPEGFHNIYDQLVGSQNNQSYIININYAVMYLSSDGLYATAIQDLLGSDACCFAWVDK